MMFIIAVVFSLNAYSNECDHQNCQHNQIIVGAQRSAEYLPLLASKRVGLVVNKTSYVSDNEHLIDFMLRKGVNITALFSPEHGIRGNAAAGEQVKNSIDQATGITVISLYGKSRKPNVDNLKNIDVLVFDIQDVGTRFYTYISTMHYIMEAAAENAKQVVILDRPNPNGHYAAGPIREDKWKSFVGMHKIPVVHGLTVGELALMINGEKWMDKGIQLAPQDLHIVKVANYSHADGYSLPVEPSPNLRTDEAVSYYPSLGLFESTTISVGRGTKMPFEVIAYPDEKLKINVELQIQDIPEAWPQRGRYSYGESYRISAPQDTRFSIKPFYDWYWKMRDLGYKSEEIVDRPEWLANLIGSESVLEMIKTRIPYHQIEAGWQSDLDKYLAMRRLYLLYPL
ncbi:exo-beta-N-acetylmuramidase NamZ family protein [Psychromonas ossibalaenae]|uniref:exo-beta-N-acetylmuramidase NamZ family protein n=1 Tax=Psychromonas ossibalaenae TaxID=444922 RepID=UPI00036FD87C|nr:DUF1343 domain-containing protein [Psychromonas ossibalaenae]